MSWYRLFQVLGPVTLANFADKHFSVAVLRPGGLLWIPFGWQAASLSEMPAVGVASAEEQTVITLVLPILSSAMAATCDIFGDVENHLRTAVGEEMSAAAARCVRSGWDCVGRGLLGWMKDVIRTAAAPGQPRLRPVIQDDDQASAVQARKLKRTVSEAADAALLEPAAKRADVRTGGSQPDALAEELSDLVAEGEAWWVFPRWAVGGWEVR